jgi:hypothetical protein
LPLCAWAPTGGIRSRYGLAPLPTPRGLLGAIGVGRADVESPDSIGRRRFDTPARCPLSATISMTSWARRMLSGADLLIYLKRLAFDAVAALGVSISVPIARVATMADRLPKAAAPSIEDDPPRRAIERPPIGRPRHDAGCHRYQIARSMLGAMSDRRRQGRAPISGQHGCRRDFGHGRRRRRGDRDRLQRP